MTPTATIEARSISHPAVPHSWSTARASIECSPTFGDVIALLEAAGPLPIAQIAGGLDVTECAAVDTVRQMIARRCLRSDEWRRYRLAGACAD